MKTVRMKFGARAGILRHLKKIGIEPKILTQIYVALIVRPVFEYASACFHTGLTTEQSNRLEKMQRISLKIIYGLSTSYADCLEKSGLRTLSDRRQTLFENFVNKSYESERFRTRGFEEKRPCGYPLRPEKVVKELFASRERLQKAPLYQARKLVNEREKR